MVSKETNARLEHKVSERERQCTAYAEQLQEAQDALRRMTTRAEEVEEHARSTERRLYQARREAELERLRAVADETRKWEEPEARLVEELERGADKRGSVRVATDAEDDSTVGERTTESSQRYMTVVTPDGQRPGM